MANALHCKLFEGPFYFLRHGETESNRLGLIAGWTDVELNESGWRQARAAAGLLKGRGITAIYSSPLRRARDTASCVAGVLRLEVVIVPDLAERNWGELEGKPREPRVREGTPPGGEGPDAFARRTLAGLSSVQRGGLPLVVAHSGTFRVLCGELGMPLPGTAVENSLPLNFVPPGTGGRWTLQTVTG